MLTVMTELRIQTQYNEGEELVIGTGTRYVLPGHFMYTDIYRNYRNAPGTLNVGRVHVLQPKPKPYVLVPVQLIASGVEHREIFVVFACF